MPEAMSLQNPRSTLGMCEGTKFPGLLENVAQLAYIYNQMLNEIRFTTSYNCSNINDGCLHWPLLYQVISQVSICQ